MKDALEEKIALLFPTLKIILSKDLLEVLENSSVDDLWIFHFGLGLYLRDNMLNPGSELYDMFVEGGVLCKDEMSSLILKMLHEYIHNRL